MSHRIMDVSVHFDRGTVPTMTTTLQTQTPNCPPYYELHVGPFIYYVDASDAKAFGSALAEMALRLVTAPAPVIAEVPCETTAEPEPVL